MAEPATRDDIRELASVGRETATVLATIAERMEQDAKDRGEVRERLAKIESSVAPSATYFEAQNRAAADAAAAHLRAASEVATTRAAWVAWWTPARVALVLPFVFALLGSFGITTGLAGRLQAVYDALLLPPATNHDPLTGNQND
jgi:hypothetical protein